MTICTRTDRQDDTTNGSRSFIVNVFSCCVGYAGGDILSVTTAASSTLLQIDIYMKMIYSTRDDASECFFFGFVSDLHQHNTPHTNTSVIGLASTNKNQMFEKN
jgi:hypothetical protein